MIGYVMSELKSFDIALYRDDVSSMKVEIVKNNSDREWDRFEIRVIQTLSINPNFDPYENGEHIKICKKRHAGAFMWSLEKINN
jgi:hypothetical protein